MPTVLRASPVIERECEKLIKQTTGLIDQGIVPTLKVILVGKHPSSLIYVKNKKKFCEKIGATCEIIELPENCSPKKFISTIKKIAKEKSTHGILVQLPVPKQLSHLDVGSLIPPEKDVDGFHAQNLKELMSNKMTPSTLIPCTPKGVLTLLKHYEIPLSGKSVVVIGRSMLVGKPMQLLLTNEDATVTLCHSKTENLVHYTHQADIIIVAAGMAGLIDTQHVNPLKRQVVIDVGMNTLADKSLCGDVNFQTVSPLVEAITPVPGGIGPMTILSLVQNLLQAASNSL